MVPHIFLTLHLNKLIIGNKSSTYIFKTPMPTSKSYADFILEQLSGLPEIASRQMMGEYILYYRDKVIGGIYDDRFLVKPVKAARERMPEAPYQLPYEGAKEMLLVDNVDNRDFLADLITSMYDELPEVKKKKKA